MTEIFSQRQLDTMIQSSKRFEHAWRVYCRPQDYSLEEVRKQMKFITDQQANLVTSSQLTPGSPEIYERICMGIFHHPEIQEPPELKYKIKQN